MSILRALTLSLFGLIALTGCTYQQTLNNMVSEARQAEIVRNAQLLCSNLDALQPQFDPTMLPLLTPENRAALQARCPTEPNPVWQITNYSFSTNAVAGAPTRRTEDVAVVAGDADGPWTQVDMNYAQTGESAAIIARFNIEQFPTPPESLTGIQAWDSVRYYVLGGVILIALIPILLIVWIIRRRRRRRQMAGG